MSAKAQDDDFIMNLIELALARPCEEREDYLRSACAAPRSVATFNGKSA